MKFNETNIKGAYIIDLEPFQDERGFFARTFCMKEFAKMGLETNFVQQNASGTKGKYVLRGMHYQINGSEEVKLVRCVRGRIQDVIIDLRKDSSTYCKYISVELSEENKRVLYVPRGFAHGFITLDDYCELTYMASAFYDSVNERGVRWNDPVFGIEWKAIPLLVSEKDSKHPDYIK